MKTQEFTFKFPADYIAAYEYNDISDEHDMAAVKAIENQVDQLMVEHKGASYSWEYGEEKTFCPFPDFNLPGCDCVEATLTIFLE